MILALVLVQKKLVLPDSVAGAHADPLGHLAILLHFLGQNAFDFECLVRRLQVTGREAWAGGTVWERWD